MQSSVLWLDGKSLTPADLLKVSDPNVQIKVTDEAWERIREGREVVNRVLDRKEISYGVNTGFGMFESVVIDPGRLAELQKNLIRSHSAGVGEPLPPHQTRKLLALRINVLAKGHSGIRVETVETMLSILNKNCVPRVPARGTVGASGDLAPLAHLALGLMGEGDMWDPEAKQYFPASQVLKRYGLQAITLQAKEGLSLINGTQLITSLASEAVVRAQLLAKQADVIAALTAETLRARSDVFHPIIHKVRPHLGQQLVAGRLRYLLNYGGKPSELSVKGNGKVQDAYSIRCIPQVHGVVNDILHFSEGLLTTECNSATDNPMIFAVSPSEKAFFNRPSPGTEPVDSKDKEGFIISGGNFHGEYPAKAADILAIGVAELGSISERRTERLVNPSLSNHLPAFLTKEGGLNSGLMIAQCTAAALHCENKVLTKPASCDSLPTSAGQEDHVSMGGFAARKAVSVVNNVEYILAIELLAACVALDLNRPLRTTAPLERVYDVVRSKVSPLTKDRVLSTDIEAVADLLRQGKIWEAAAPYIHSAYHCLPNFDAERISLIEKSEEHAQIRDRHISKL